MPFPRSTALLLIDVQKAWDEPHWGNRNNPLAESRIAELLTAFRNAARPVIHVKHSSRDPHSPLHPSAPGHAFKPEGAPKPGETVFDKPIHSAFIGTGLDGHLRARGIDRLVIAGFSTPWCVSSTARSAGDLGFKVVVVQDACAAFELEDFEGKLIPPDTLHRVALSELHGNFATIVHTSDLLGMI
jgi:nicotinamidase-related amidase